MLLAVAWNHDPRLTWARANQSLLPGGAALKPCIVIKKKTLPLSLAFLQSRPFQGPMPLLRQAPSGQRHAQSATPTAPVPPQMPLNVLVPVNGAGGVSAPATPVVVYATPHGYMMAYPPPGFVNTPQTARSQVWMDGWLTGTCVLWSE